MLIPKINVASSVSALLDTLTNFKRYCNCLDTRLLTAVTVASGSTEAKKLLNKFKTRYYSRKISEVLIHCKYEIKPLDDSIILSEKYKGDPNNPTVNDLLAHQYKIEKVLKGNLKLK